MVFFSLFMMWAYSWNDYRVKGEARTSIWRPLWDRSVLIAINHSWLLTLVLPSIVSTTVSTVIFVKTLYLLTIFQPTLQSRSTAPWNSSSTTSEANHMHMVLALPRLTTRARLIPRWTLEKHSVWREVEGHLVVSPIARVNDHDRATMRISG